MTTEHTTALSVNVYDQHVATIEWVAARLAETARPLTRGARKRSRSAAARHIISYYAALPEDERLRAIAADTTS